jgi:hypothetical protein
MLQMFSHKGYNDKSSSSLLIRSFPTLNYVYFKQNLIQVDRENAPNHVLIYTIIEVTHKPKPTSIFLQIFEVSILTPIS